MTTPAWNPLPCGIGGGDGDPAPDVEQNVLCEIDAEGNLIGTALAVYVYDENGNPVGAPTFVDPITGDPYVVTTGTLQVCPDGASMGPVQFCQTGTSTAPAEHPGRMYDLTLPINPGFSVESMVVDAVTNAAGITWEVDDPDGAAFATALDAFMTARLPTGTTVTVTNPNAGVAQVCGAATPMTVHIECIRLDQSPPNLIELVYNAGQDMVQNPAYNESPALNPPVSQGNYGFRLLSREDDPGPFPINQPANDALCTTVANRGWETNDVGRTFEIWGNDITSGSNVTPTPRGTPVQEMASDGPPGGQLSTIWQTFQAPASGNFIIRVVHGARDPGETHRITLDNGDTGSAQNGHLIDDTSNPPSVTSNGGPNPWTQFNQSIPLTSGQVYTLSLSTTNPAGPNRGGLFTDMRAYIDRPGQRATATNNDDTCVVTVDETTTTTTCSFWQPQSAGGDIVGWERLDNGLTLSNAEFWAQTPTPSCCALTASDGGDGGGTTNANLVVSDIVCVIVGGVSSNAIRTVVLDPSGGQLSQQFLGPDGVPVTPDNWTAGSCTTNRTLFDVMLCDFGTLDAQGQPTTFMRKYVQSLSATLQGQVNSHRDFNAEGTSTYVAVGPVRDCASSGQADRESACWTTTAGGATVFTGTIRHDDSLPTPGWILFDQNQTPVSPTEPGLTFVPCGVVDPLATTGLCLADGSPIAVVTRADAATGVVTQEGWLNLATGVFSAGLPPVGTRACSSAQSIQVSGVFCSVDDTTGDVLALVLIEYTYAPDGSIASVRLVNATTGATYVVPAGASITTCPSGAAGPERDFEVLCSTSAGVTTPFVRDYTRDENGAVIGFTDYTLAGAPFVPAAVGVCTGRDSETIVLCDSATTPNRFLRTYTYTSAGAVAGFTDTTLAGGVFTPTGAVGVCATTVQSDTDFVEEVLCDGNGTAFIRLFRFNSTTGTLLTVTNTTLAGVAFTPVGAVGRCSECCPIEIGRGCYTGGSGFYTAIRNADGTISLIDSVSGATVLAANIVACPSDNTVVTLTAQHRLIGDADAAWTPGADVVGALTSVTYTVLSGTATVTDQSGTSAAGLPAGLSTTWNAEDNNTLSGPTSIDAIGGQTYVTWTQR